MIFNSFTFLFFLIIFLLSYWFLNKNSRLFLVFFSSLLFYGFWRLEFIFLVLFSITVNYYSSIYISSKKFISKKKILLSINLIINFGLLAFFKYYYFISDNLNYLFKFFEINFHLPIINILLPIGISFYTFQSASYVIDVYNKKIEPEKNFILFSNYVIFFPQLVAGPILRASEVIWQLAKKPRFKIENFYEGFKKIIFGLFLKVVIADNLAPFVDQAFSVDSKYLSAIDVFTISYLFGFQIYFDFSAYSFIAIGIALLMDIKFPENFNFPYHSISPKEFWTRWHITLSSWVRDYLYLPLLKIKNLGASTGGFKKNILLNNLSYKYIYVLMITWSLMGLWHGANWKFIIWGIAHAMIIILFRCIEKLFGNYKNKYINFFSWLITLQLIMLSWIPFRANNFLETLNIWHRLFDFESWFQMSLRENFYLIAFVITVGYLILPYIYKFFDKLLLNYAKLRKFIEISCLFIFITLIIIYFKVIHQFIYFQF